jgi:cytochrome c-type biogenesis protein CcmH
MRPLRRFVWLACLLLFAGAAMAQAIEPLPFKDHAEEVRYQHLTAQLRCPMCQNETLADSNAPIARDLRNHIFQLMQHGQSDAQIKQYLVDRYSQFVLYDPPVARNTWLLWFGPLLILLVGAAAVVATIRQRSRAATPATSATPPDALDEGDDW